MVRQDRNPPASRHSRKGKPATKRDHIECTLRRRIVEGKDTPGSRLPLRTELEKRFQAGPVTVQRALDRLIEQGFVQARGRGGTYVVDHPPHLSQYALVFPRHPGQEGWNRFWTALSNEAQKVEAEGHRRIRIYHGVHTLFENKDYEALLADAETECLAGIIFAFYPGFLDGTPLLTTPNLPRILVLCEQKWPGMPATSFDNHRLIDKALDHFVHRQRRRIAMISPDAFAESNERYFSSGLTARGLSSRAYWIQAVVHSPPQWVQRCAHLLMHGNQSERPDGLLIADDNLVEPVTAGLVAAGVRVPEELEVVGHCNFPWPTPSHVPITRLGYDVRQFLEICMRSVDRQRRGEKEPSIIPIPPLFEDELPLYTREPVPLAASG